MILRIFRLIKSWFSMFGNQEALSNMKKKEEKEQKPEEQKEFKFEILQIRDVNTNLNKQIQEVTNIKKKRDNK